MLTHRIELTCRVHKSNIIVLANYTSTVDVVAKILTEAHAQCDKVVLDIVAGPRDILNEGIVKDVGVLSKT